MAAALFFFVIVLIIVVVAAVSSKTPERTLTIVIPDPPRPPPFVDEGTETFDPSLAQTLDLLPAPTRGMPRRHFMAPAVGVTHANSDGSSRQKLIVLHAEPGMAIDLRRERHNPVDPNAIGVFLRNGAQLGYLTAELAAEISERVDGGHHYYSAKINEISKTDIYRVLLQIEVATRWLDYIGDRRELIAEVAKARRTGDYGDVENRLLADIESREAIARKHVRQPGGVSLIPWCHERLAIIYRRQKRYADEAAILTRYCDFQASIGGTVDPVLTERRQRALQLAERQN
jgi:hypothetical protein